jgi:hypothetical protein
MTQYIKHCQIYNLQNHCISDLTLAYHLKIPLAKVHALLCRMHLPIIDSHHLITVSHF